MSGADPSGPSAPPLMTQEEIDIRREAATQALEDPVSIENSGFRFSLDRASGSFIFTDLKTGVEWYSNPESTLLGRASLWREDRVVWVPIARFDEIELKENELRGRVVLIGEDEGVLGTLEMSFRPIADLGSLAVSFRIRGQKGWNPMSLCFPENGFWTTDADEGMAVLPVRMGEILSTEYVLPGYKDYLTYDDISMALYGAVKQGSGLLLSWAHPDVALRVISSWPDLPQVAGARMISATLTLSAEAGGFLISPVGWGGYVEIGKAYRDVAWHNGWLVTWEDKAIRSPSVGQMFGAADFKPFVLSRTVPSSRYNSSGKEEVSPAYTFDEVAQCAEHLHNELEIDRALYVLAGWTHRGYDNQHPDILPAAPECGGNEALANCSQRVRDTGYLFGLHDNYQDMYEDAPSWDPGRLNKDALGNPKMGGNWAGGQAWQVCAREQVKLARRKTNFPSVLELFSPTCSFIDTTLAWNLVTCDDPAHPMTRAQDMRYKSALCDLAKKHFGLLGSEEGREWAVPHVDYMEGLLSHKVAGGQEGREGSRQDGSQVIPLFEIVYGDCVNLYTHQSDRLTPDRPDAFLDHILCAEMPVYAFGSHLYFKENGSSSAPDSPERCFSRADGGWAEGFCEMDRFIKNTYEVLCPLNLLTSQTAMSDHQFLTEDLSVECSAFGEAVIFVNHGDEPYQVHLPGEWPDVTIPQWGFVVWHPQFLAFYAIEFDQLCYDSPVLFTIMSLDGRSVRSSRSLRIYHGFGNSRLTLFGRTHEVQREEWCVDARGE